MATISSHVLDTLRGDHARGIRVSCYRIVCQDETTETRTKVFSVAADEQGRITQEVDLLTDPAHRIELVFHSAEYFDSMSQSAAISMVGDASVAMQIMPELVVRLDLPEPDIRYHLPVVLSPHSCTLWWSGVSSL